MQKTYKYRAYPNKTQVAKLNQHFGAKRFVWNQCLAWRSGWYQAYGESVSGIDYSRILTTLKKHEYYHWLKNTPSSPLTQALRDQDKAFKSFFKSGFGYPKFKSRYQNQSIRFQMDKRCIDTTFKAGSLLKITGLGALKIKWSRLPTGKPKMVTISRDKAERYFVSMSIEEHIEFKPPVGKVTGVDIGILDSIILSDGSRFENQRHLLKQKAQIKKIQQRLSRQIKLSGRWGKTKSRLARLHLKIADARQDHIQKMTTQIINENQVIICESLNVKGMTRSSRGNAEQHGKMVKQKAGLNKAILDVSFSEILRQLEYKATWYGRTFIQVDQYFASSKICSYCGTKNKDLTLKDRQWTCGACHETHDRDINAAINIEHEGLKQLLPAGTSGFMRDSGSEGVYSMAVSPRSSNQPKPCLEHG